MNADMSLDYSQSQPRKNPWGWDSVQPSPLEEGDLIDLYNNDFLWACMIHTLFEYEDLELQQLNNLVLRYLLHSGIINWKGVNNQLHQATQAC